MLKIIKMVEFLKISSISDEKIFKNKFPSSSLFTYHFLERDWKETPRKKNSSSTNSILTIKKIVEKL